MIRDVWFYKVRCSKCDETMADLTNFCIKCKTKLEIGRTVMKKAEDQVDNYNLVESWWSNLQNPGRRAGKEWQLCKYARGRGLFANLSRNPKWYDIPSGWFARSSQPSPHLADPGQVGLGQTRRWELFANIIVNRNMFHKCFEVFGSWFIFAPQSEPLFSMLFQTSAKCRDCQVSREYRSSSLHLLQLLKILQPGHLAARLKWRRKILKICCNLLLSVDIAECFFLERAST